MISLYPTGGAATASRGSYDNVVRLLPSGGVIAGGEGEWVLDRIAAGFLNLGGDGAVVGGAAKYPALLCYLTGAGAVGGGAAKYPWRFDRSVAGALAGGGAVWPIELLAAGGAVGGNGDLAGQGVMFTYWWGLAIAKTGTGCVAGGISPVVYKLYSDAMLQFTPTALDTIIRTSTTKYFKRIEV